MKQQKRVSFCLPAEKIKWQWTQALNCEHTLLFLFSQLGPAVFLHCVCSLVAETNLHVLFSCYALMWPRWSTIWAPNPTKAQTDQHVGFHLYVWPFLFPTLIKKDISLKDAVCLHWSKYFCCATHLLEQTWAKPSLYDCT